MIIRKYKDKVYVTADKNKAFKMEHGYTTRIILDTEDAVQSLVEVYYHNGNEITEEMHRHYTLLHELKEIRDWFVSTDYIPNKVIVGEWTTDDPRFIAYCEERKKIRARQDEIKKLLGYQ